MGMRKPSAHPVFEKYTILHIARQTGYSLEYLREVRRGDRPATARLRRLCSLALAEPEEALFAVTRGWTGEAGAEHGDAEG